MQVEYSRSHRVGRMPHVLTLVRRSRVRRPMVRRVRLPFIILGVKPDLDRMRVFASSGIPPKRMAPFRGIMCRLILSVSDTIGHATWSDEGRPCRPSLTWPVVTSQWVGLFNPVMALAFCSSSSCDQLSAFQFPLLQPCGTPSTSHDRSPVIRFQIWYIQIPGRESPFDADPRKRRWYGSNLKKSISRPTLERNSPTRSRRRTLPP